VEFELAIVAELWFQPWFANRKDGESSVKIESAFICRDMPTSQWHFSEMVALQDVLVVSDCTACVSRW